MDSCPLDETKVEEGIQALLKVLESHRLSQKKTLLTSSAPIFLQIDFVKIPKIKKRIIRIPLENSLLTDISNVCLIVADLIRGRKVNHEVTLNYYKKLLQKRGVLDVQKLHIMSSRQIRVEYAQFEAKRKLCNMFDAFLIDEKISKYLRPKLGKHFHRARKWPIPVRMKRKDLKSEILSKLKKTSMCLDGSGPTKTVQVGRVDMSLCEVSRNIIKVCKYISKHFPGGWKNIRSLNIKGLRSISVPIYMSLISRNSVPTPTIKQRKRKRILATDELSTVGKKVTVYRSGKVKIHRS